MSGIARTNLYRLLMVGSSLVIGFLVSRSTSGFLFSSLVLLVISSRILHCFQHGFNSLSRPWKWRTLLVLFILASVLVALIRPGVVPWWEVMSRGIVVAVLGWFLFQKDRPRWVWIGGQLVGLVLIPPMAALHPLQTLPKRTPAALGLQYEEVEFRTADGMRLGGWLMRHPEARGNVVCCHGHGRNRGHLIGLWQTLHEMKLNILVFDFRGHGWSDGQTSTLGQCEVEDVVAAESYLHHRCPNKPSLLIGISLGAASALRSLPRLPWVRGVWSEGSYARLGAVVDHEFALLPEWISRPLVATYQFFAWLDCDLQVEHVNPVDALQGLNVPIYFCHGEEDALIPFCNAEILAMGYSGPQEHWWVPQATHYNIRQRNPEEYKERLRKWLEARLFQ